LDLLRTVPGSDKVVFVASSVHQLELLLADEKFRHQVIGLRINPGFGSGYHSKTVVAGPKYSFGIWHESLDKVRADFKIKKIHSHIGAGSDPTYWLKSAEYLLSLIENKFPACEVLNLGGGFKVARGDLEKAIDLKPYAAQALEIVRAFNSRTGR
jgi:diaminopimelate decarboxylase